jgi:hypothetical protein
LSHQIRLSFPNSGGLKLGGINVRKSDLRLTVPAFEHPDFPHAQGATPIEKDFDLEWSFHNIRHKTPQSQLQNPNRKTHVGILGTPQKMPTAHRPLPTEH